MANIYEIEKRVNDLTKAMDRLSKDHDTLKAHVFQLADKVEQPTKPAETFTEERTSDDGTMTIANRGNYIDIVNILMSNGYFVCCHVDDENNGETITIEFWRA